MPKSFKELDKGSLFDKEEKVLSFWKKNKVFEKSLKKNPKSRMFSFYDGPPFITGSPHYGNLLSSIAKDLIARYQTMKGNYVPRVWGWDVHGLPIENKVEKELGLRNRKDIEKLGIKKFIEKAREYVNVNTAEWRWYVDHIGRWADLDNPYRTDDFSYMESVMWVFKQLYDKGLVYKGNKVFLYCTRCATVVSKFETTMEAGNYKDVEDPAVTVAFKLKNKKDTYLLAWTTTPWTLPANNGLAVNPKLNYATITDGRVKYVLAEETLERYEEFKDWKKVRTQTGKELVGESFEPLFDPNFEINDRKDFKVWGASFPTVDEGTGIVHIAPAFGEDDFKLGQAKGVSVPIILDEDGKFLEDLPFSWADQYFKKANPEITAELKKKGLLVKEGVITHSYPHCYRCSTPLIYMAKGSWLVKINKIRQDLLDANKKINWVPSHFGEKRFVYNIETAPEWSVSRTRYWGIPIPIWETEDGEIIVPGSVKEIEAMSGQKVTDLHRPYIDDVVLKTPDGKKAYRVPEVLDVWFESGSMPFAQDHYPFENKKKFEQEFPTDYIAEHTGQLRGWFYSLHVLATAVKGKPAFKNAVVTGTLAGTDGRKMSKSFNNFPDARDTMEKFGAEALRLYLMSNRIMLGEDTSFSERDLKEARGAINILHNTHKYFITYANLHEWKPSKNSSVSKHVLDQWILARLNQVIDEYGSLLDEFNIPNANRAIQPFIEDLSTWYIRRGRDRFVDGDKDALATLYEVLYKFSKVIASILPFTAEQIHQSLKQAKDPLSVHLCDYPKANKKMISSSKQLLEKMDLVRNLASAVHNLRAEASQPLRQKMASVVLKDVKGLKTKKELVQQLQEEVNVQEVKFDTNLGKTFVSTKVDDVTVALDTKLTDELKEEGLLREVVRALQEARKKSGLNVGEKANLKYEAKDKGLAELIEKYSSYIQESSHFEKIEEDKVKSGTDLLDGKLTVKVS